MKAKRTRILGLLLALATATQLGACRIGDIEISMDHSELNSYKNVFQINDEKYPEEIAKLYLCNYRNLYGKTNGLDLWQGEDTASLESYVKDVTIQELSQIVSMDLLAKEQEITLTQEEKEKAGKAAENYYNSLNEAELSYTGIRKNQVQRAYEDYALADKLYQVLTEDTREEVSDDEGRVIRVLQIYVKDAKAAAAIEKELKKGTDFLTVAEGYNSSGDIEKHVARGEYPAAVAEAAFNLDNDAVSGKIKTDEGYYFIKCLSKFEEELTEKNKEKIRIQREKQKFEDSYNKFVEEANFRMNDHLWNKVSLADTENITTDSFFTVYNKYFR